ncbi:MAG: hypothetical protein JXM69_04105 [Anaerolineae bacterium]|nr:hypothetical protein [Anaerolineae bacterium]
MIRNPVIENQTANDRGGDSQCPQHGENGWDWLPHNQICDRTPMTYLLK